MRDSSIDSAIGWQSHESTHLITSVRTHELYSSLWVHCLSDSQSQSHSGCVALTRLQRCNIGLHHSSLSITCDCPSYSVLCRGGQFCVGQTKGVIRLTFTLPFCWHSFTQETLGPFLLPLVYGLQKMGFILSDLTAKVEHFRSWSQSISIL